ncbi:nucleoprotein [hymenopteran rhabdo-related virus 24]|uniref:Nucleoprotein n=1 Tax=hymenopteran rhabdo-related virus 24 TaxID=2847805 RepID=A0A7U3NUQ9_9RHAB|nr:nucleoprotein [hymenopteran rhabdo-related virus 24]QPB73979.1 nucleoprotein [hymenopteran rhabdo-related virus 24]
MDLNSHFSRKLELMDDTTFTKSGIDKDWDETVFEAKYENLKVKYYGEDLASQITTAKIFLNWYVGGDLGPSFDLTSLMIKTLGFFSLSDKSSLLSSLKPKSLDTSLPLSFSTGIAGKIEKLNLSKHTSEATYFASSGHTILSVSPGGILPGMASNTDASTSTTTTTVATVQEFYEYCWNILDSTPPSQEMDTRKSSSEMVLIILNYLGYLSLITSRYAVKTQQSVTNYYSRAATRNFNNISGTTMSITTPPPHSKSIQSILQTFTKGSSAFSMYLIMEIKMFKTSLNMEEDTIINILTAGNLLHFKFNGMLLINAASKLCLLAKLTLKGLLDTCAFSSFENSLTRLIDVSNNFISSVKAKEQISFPWCRLIDDKYMTRLSADPNKPLLDLWLTAISELDNNPDVWSLYPWNGTVPQNKFFKIWVDNLRKTIEPKSFVPLTQKAKSYLEPGPGMVLGDPSTSLSNDDEEYSREI